MPWPLMANNVTRQDLDALIDYLSTDDPRLTNGEKVRQFEAEWSNWLEVNHSIFVNSGAMANMITMDMLLWDSMSGQGLKTEVIVPAITWVSDITSITRLGLMPVVVDVTLDTLAMNLEMALEKINDNTLALFLTHTLGLDAFGGSQEMIDAVRAKCARHGAILVEDCCESHGTMTAGDRKVGTIGNVSNFSFYYAHHMSTIEGGMICTNNSRLAALAQAYRSHGMTREIRNSQERANMEAGCIDLSPDFIFAVPGYNARSTELNAVLGLEQLKNLDTAIAARSRNFKQFCKGLDRSRYFTDFTNIEGNSSYALPLVMLEQDNRSFAEVEQCLREMRIEFRRGLSGGGNQLRQPYFKKLVPGADPASCPVADYLHFNSCYIGNYPAVSVEDVTLLCSRLNTL